MALLKNVYRLVLLSIFLTAAVAAPTRHHSGKPSGKHGSKHGGKHGGKHGPKNTTSSNIKLDANPIQLVPGKYFDRFVVIVLENTDYATALQQPYLANLATLHNGVALTQYSAVAHPSQPNYVAMIKGNTDGVFLDFDSTLHDTTIVDLLEPKGITWKAYAEDYSGGCALDSTEDNGLYARKHVPFISFTTITNDPNRCANIVNASQLDIDIANNAVPQFVFYTPNMNDDGHDTSTAYAINWLESFLEPRIKESAFWDNTAILITFDEQENYLSLQNHVFSVIIGGAVQRGMRTDGTAYNHYSILATVEENWDLGNLGRHDVGATPFVLRDNGLAQKIKNVILVIMENRSFDKLAGYFDYNKDIRGLTGNEYNLFNTSDPNSLKVYASKGASYVDPDDPDHSIAGVVEQITGRTGSAFGPFAASEITMSGFVQDHAQTYNITPDQVDRLSHVMNSFAPEEVPIVYALAQNFVLVDGWHASVPGSTQPNRLYAHSATSAGETTTTASSYVKGYPQRTIFNALSDAGITWKNYFQELPSTIVFDQLRELSFVENFKTYDHFVADAASGSLPQYSFIDPVYEDLVCFQEDDEHPSSPVYMGEAFIKNIYETLRASPQWEESLLIITWDEHGGFYDHMPTPLNVPEPDGISGTDFQFNRLGIRVPALLISPWVGKGTVLHDPKGPSPDSKYEHSSVPAFLHNLFGLPSFLTKRDAWAGTFEDAILDSIRTDTPVSLPPAPNNSTTSPSTGILSDIEKAACNALKTVMSTL